MVKKPVTIGPHNFSKKGDAAAFLRAMLHRYDVGDKVSAADAEVLHAALALHPNAAAKMGARAALRVRHSDFFQGLSGEFDQFHCKLGRTV
jgi:Protein of unknown function (DUF3223)